MVYSACFFSFLFRLSLCLLLCHSPLIPPSLTFCWFHLIFIFISFTPINFNMSCLSILPSFPQSSQGISQNQPSHYINDCTATVALGCSHIYSMPFVWSMNGKSFFLLLWFIEVFTARLQVNAALNATRTHRFVCLLDRVLVIFWDYIYWEARCQEHLIPVPVILAKRDGLVCALCQ